MSRDIFTDAEGKWPSLLPMLGVDPRHLTGRNCPCPMCGGKDRFRFTNFCGKGNWICNSCGHGSGVDLLMSMHKTDFTATVRQLREKLGMAKETKPIPRMSSEKTKALCLQLWKESRAISAGDEVERYLLGRGFAPPFSPQLRFHASVPVRGHPTALTLPAMLARVSNNSGLGVNIHRTYLDGGSKAVWEEDGVAQSPKKLMPGTVPADAAIRLWPHEGVLAVAEGIETALAVHRLTGMPCWSLICAGQMAKWTPPKGVRELHIYSDNDAKFAGQAAAFTLASKVATGQDPPAVFVLLPERTGQDWADET